MRICLITPRPGHPLLAATTALLTPRHRIDWIDPGARHAVPEDAPLADVYLLKARTPRALALARAFEERGAPVVNSAAATGFCQDRTAMAALAGSAGLPFARTRTVGALRDLAAEAGLPYPLVIKSRHSRRHDLVARVDDAGALHALCGSAEWADEPVVVQPFTANSGWDHKVWVIAGQAFAALRRSELADSGADSEADSAGVGHEPAVPLALSELPAGWLDLVLRAGSVFALDVYGVDLIDAGDGAPLIVDINAFPGIRGQAGAPEALAALALRTAAGGSPVLPR
ncbi:RimK family alpha-L-glutamate ligase [Streptomyces sp. NPDC059396]|uniref:ATP-grasp domain-containing protein n=1 Tax=Streptomyces sp. NPDC059396 TaxID=3346819 RepID=UPI0036B4C178